MKKNRNENSLRGARGLKELPSAKRKAPSSAHYDLGVPGLVAKCLDDLYRSTGVSFVPRDRILVLSITIGVVIGLVGGYMPGGRLWGVIGAALGAFFGLIGGVGVGAVLHFGLEPWLRPEAWTLRLTRAGRIRSASRAIRRAKWWVGGEGNAFSRAFFLLLNLLGLGRSDLPPDIALANIEACSGVFAESVGDTQEAVESYARALKHWPRHGFVLVSLLDLIIREDFWEMVDDARSFTETFVKQTRDKSLQRVANEYIEMLEPAPDMPERPLRIAEEPSTYAPKVDVGKALLTCKLIENPGSQISNGVLFITDSKAERVVKLPPMPFQLMMMLAEAMRGAVARQDPAQIGWVSINDLLNSLPWTTPNVTNSNVHKLVYKTRNTLAANEVDRNFIEENANGCYRLSLAPENIIVERVAAA